MSTILARAFGSLAEHAHQMPDLSGTNGSRGVSLGSPGGEPEGVRLSRTGPGESGKPMCARLCARGCDALDGQGCTPFEVFCSLYRSRSNTYLQRCSYADTILESTSSKNSPAA
jgi:hypothetical protein